jgi:multidrug efflux pump subunit AcrA (membrane-fusion protein)
MRYEAPPSEGTVHRKEPGGSVPKAMRAHEAPSSLLRGMFVHVRLHVDVEQPLVSVPQEAVRPTGDLFVMRDGRLTTLRPRPFHATSDRITYDQRESGLLPGDRVVVSQISTPRDGMELAEAAP